MLLILLTFTVIVFLYAQYAIRVNQDVETRFKLFVLRDKLRNLALDNQVDSEDRLFKAVDTSISKTIKLVPHLNLRTILLFYLLNRKRADFKIVNEEFFDELFIPKNIAYRKIYEEFADITIDHLKQQHYVVKIALLGIIRSIIILQPCINFLIKIVKDYPTYRESSTLYRYYPAQ